MHPEGFEPSLAGKPGLNRLRLPIPPWALNCIFFSLYRYNRFKIPMVILHFLLILAGTGVEPAITTGYEPGMVIPFHSPAEPIAGIEPATYCLQGSRTANCAISAKLSFQSDFKYARQESNPQSLDISQVQRTASPQALTNSRFCAICIRFVIVFISFPKFDSAGCLRQKARNGI